MKEGELSSPSFSINNNYNSIMAKKSLRVLKDGEEIYPSSISTRNIFDANGLNLEEKIDSINNVTAAFSEGTTIATVNGTAIKVPNMSAS